MARDKTNLEHHSRNALEPSIAANDILSCSNYIGNQSGALLFLRVCFDPYLNV